MSILRSRILPRKNHSILSCFLWFFLDVMVSQTLLIFDDFNSFEEDYSGILWVAVYCNFSGFLMIRLGYGFGGEHYKSEVSLSSHHVMGTYSTWLLTLTLPHGGSFISFFRCKVILLSIISSLQGCLSVQLTLEEWGLCCTPSRSE